VGIRRDFCVWNYYRFVSTSDVVETVTSEIETRLKLRDRDFAIKAETETWKFETGTRDLAFL